MVVAEPRPGAVLSSYLTSVPDVVVHVGPELDTFIPVVHCDGEALDLWLAQVGRYHDGMDDKVRAAYLIGGIAWWVSLRLGALYLRGRGVPDMDPAHLAFALEWGVAPEGHDVLNYDMAILAAADTSMPWLDRDGFRRLLEAIHAPLVERLHARTKLGRSAMWRLVSDAVAAGLLDVGKRTCIAPHAMAEADGIVHHPGSPLANKQTGFVEITAFAKDDRGELVGCEWFRARGGCCRYYTIPSADGEYCSTCVLRKPESRDELLRNWVLEQAAARELPA
jgi:hypothetical protein